MKNTQDNVSWIPLRHSRLHDDLSRRYDTAATFWPSEVDSIRAKIEFDALKVIYFSSFIISYHFLHVVI